MDGEIAAVGCQTAMRKVGSDGRKSPMSGVEEGCQAVTCHYDHLVPRGQSARLARGEHVYDLAVLSADQGRAYAQAGSNRTKHLRCRTPGSSP
eukprot:1187423-Prorocentrum_minimum.AAC.4